MQEPGPPQPGLWRMGVLLQASYQQLKKSPMKVIKALPEGKDPDGKCQTIALCKKDLLSTYKHYNDYTTPPGCVLLSADESQCKYPSVVISPTSKVAFNLRELYSELQINPNELELTTGLPQPLVPDVLLVSQLFMQTYGFYRKEQVWYRQITLAPLERVILTPCGTAEQLAMAFPAEVIGQLYQLCKQEIVTMQQDFDYILRAKLPPVTTAQAKSSEQSESSAEQQEHVLAFRVLEATPILQGVVTESTTIVLLPPDEQDVETSWFPHSEDRLSRRRSTRDEGMGPRRESAASASDIQLDEEDAFYIGLPNSEFEDYIIEAVAISDYRLRSHCIVLPKQSASAHGVFHCQTVWVCAAPSQGITIGTNFDDLTLPLANEGLSNGDPRLHPALVFVYDDEFELEQYVPPNRLGAEYEAVDLTCAYVHPELLFFLYPETLSFSRRYQMLVKRCKETVPTLREMKVAEVYQPEEEVADSRTLLYGCLRDQWLPPYFSDIRPPGLEEFCDSLFSFFIPAFRGAESTQPRRSPSVLMTGPHGVGKRTVIRAVARRCRMHVVEISCFEFCSEVVGFSEKKISVYLDKGSSNAPVVILLKDIHMMGMRDSIHSEPRLLAMFEGYMHQVDQFNRTRQYPIIVVGVSSHPGAIPARVQGCFLHQLDVTTPTQVQRLSMLESLSRGYHLAPEIDLTDLVKRTAGFTVGDFQTLYSSAFDVAYEETEKYCVENNGSGHPGDLAVMGVVMSGEHIERSLSTLHSSHADAIGAPKIPNVRWEDVGGLGDAKREILDTIQLPLLHPELFSTGVQRSGVLLYGPPGTGKTLLAKAVATECSLNFLSVKGPELINMYVGQSEENIREVFARASSAAPSVIFFDELDSIAPNRGRSGDSGGVMDRVVSQLLAELDGLNKSEHVFVIGASNRPDLIDPALLRPGRFDRMVYLGISEDSETKVKILKAITRKFNLSSEVDLEEIATRCPPNLTGADLYSLCSDATLTALRKQIGELERNNKTDDEWEGEMVVTQEDFIESLEHLTPSVPPEELEKYRKVKENLRS